MELSDDDEVRDEDDRDAECDEASEYDMAPLIPNVTGQAGEVTESKDLLPVWQRPGCKHTSLYNMNIGILLYIIFVYPV